MKTFKFLSVTFVVAALATTTIMFIEMLTGPVVLFFSAAALVFIAGLYVTISTIVTRYKESKKEPIGWHMNKMKSSVN